MATVTIGGMTLGTAGNLTGAAVLEMEDSTSASVYYTAATLRTRMFAGGTGFTAADPLVCGTLNASGTSTLAAVTATTGTFDNVLYLGTSGTPGSNRSGYLAFQNSSAVKNFRLAFNDTIAGAWEFQQSSAAGGTTYSTILGIISSGGIFAWGGSRTTARITADADLNTLTGFDVKNTGATGGVFVAFTNSANALAGSISHSGTTAVTYNTSSDRRLKQNIVPLTDVGALIDALTPVEFAFIADPDKRVRGFIAQDVYEVFPEAVTTGKTWSMDYGRITPLLAAEIKSLRARVRDLEARLK